MTETGRKQGRWSLSRLADARVSGDTLGKICLALFVCMLLPLVLIALYNYPADDDFFHALEAARRWLASGSLWQAASGVWERIVGLRQTWQGNFFQIILVSSTPLIFSIDLYFLANWFVLAMLCGSLYALCRTLLTNALGVGRWPFWIVYTSLIVLALQFMPSVADGVYWNAGAAYVSAFAFELFVVNGLLRCEGLGAKRPGRAATIARSVLLPIGAFLLGGSQLPVMTSFIVLLALLSLSAFLRKSPARLQYALALFGMAAGLAVCLSAPGNGVRQTLSEVEPSGLVFTLTQSVGESLDYFGRKLSPQLLSVLMLALPALWTPIKESRFRFRYPLLVFVMLYGAFASTFAPLIYTQGNAEMAERYDNVIYLNMMLAVVASAVYAEGWLCRYLQSRALPVPGGLGKRFSALYLALCVVMLAFGGFGFTIMNTASLSAAKSLATGEATRFREEMAEREEYIRVTPSDDTHVEMLSQNPYVFKRDRLPFQGTYGRVRYMKQYYEAFYNARNPE